MNSLSIVTTNISNNKRFNCFKINKLSKALHLSMLFVSTVVIPTTSYASLNDELYNNFNSLSNITKPNYFENERRGIIAGGELNIRSPIKTVNIASLNLPSASASCSGIDLYGGSLSFINKDEYIDLLRAVAANAQGYAFQIALSSMCEKCMQHMETLQKKIQALNQYFGNSCQLAQGIVNNTINAVNQKNLSDAKLVASFNGAADIFTLNSMKDSSEIYKTANQFTKNIESTYNNKNNRSSKSSEISLTQFTGNLVWNILSRNNEFQNNPVLKNEILSIFGTIIIEEDGENLSILPGGLISISDLIFGGKVNYYECIDTDCINVKSSTKSIIGIKSKIDEFLFGDNNTTIGIVTKFAKNQGEISNDELKIINNLPATFLVMLRDLSLKNQGSAQTFAREISTYLSIILVKNLIDQYIKLIYSEISNNNNAYTPMLLENINEIKRQLSYDFSDLFLKYGSEKSIRESYLTHLKIISKNHNKKSANSLF